MNPPDPNPRIELGPGVQGKYDQALRGLSANVRKVFGYDQPVLIEGGIYPGVWLECAPHEGLVYARYEPLVARANHEVFFHHQREDGFLPSYVWFDSLGAGWTQMVVPIAATAWELSLLLADEAFLARAYSACSRWDDWLARHRNTRGTGLCEAFCEYDTGHDNSPRWANLPHACAQGDARICPDAGKLPYLAPDLSATVYGGRVAGGRMGPPGGKTRGGGPGGAGPAPAPPRAGAAPRASRTRRAPPISSPTRRNAPNT